ncbi:hypothetical protein ABEF81_08590 [Acinetobacter thermotolerans]|uniref:hypothetical protein n=1 Tax=Acinetobacter thermotolerans TaxID=3151487 RepID=UPI00325B2215
MNILLKGFDANNIPHTESIAVAAVVAIVTAVVALAFGVYSYVQMRKMQKKNRPKASQIDGAITGEGTIVHDIAGSPHLYGNDVEIFNQSASEIKQKSGGK